MSNTSEENIVIKAQALSANVRLTQITSEVLGKAVRPSQRVTQFGIQVLRKARLNHVMSGGITFSGSFIAKPQISRIMNGGVQIGNTNTIAIRGFSHPISGGIKIKGYCDTATINGSTEVILNNGSWSPASTYITHQVLVTGSSRNIIVNRVLPVKTGNNIGGLTFSGPFEYAFTIPGKSSGGVVIAGKAICDIKHFYTMKGGLNLSGITINKLRNIAVMNGGISTTGTTIQGSAFRHFVLGGVSTGGQASYSLILKHNITGGISLSSNATNKPAIFSNPTGGISVGGTALLKHLIPYTSKGGITLSGTSKSIKGELSRSNGGVSLQGISGAGGQLRATYNYLSQHPNNKIFLYGRANYGRNSYSYVMNGGLIVRGKVTTDFCAKVCDTREDFYRKAEKIPGCKVIANKKIQYICVKEEYMLPHDNKRTPRSGALVAAITLCNQNHNKQNQRNCASFINFGSQNT